jgi:outer membrane protein assembly factor BamB
MLLRLSGIILLALIVLQVADQEGTHEHKGSEDRTVLEPNGKPWGCPDDPIPPLAISSDRILVTACNSLYMLDSKKRIVWKWATSGPAITDQPVIDSSATIYVIAYDLIWVALDARTGELKWRKDSNGRSGYTQIMAYRDDQYLVVVNEGGYRESLSDSTIPDGLLLCKGGDVIWSKEFPPDAKLQVWGDRILAVTSANGRAEIIEIPTN